MMWGLGIGLIVGFVASLLLSSRRRRPAQLEVAEQRAFDVAVSYLAAYGDEAEETILYNASGAKTYGFGNRIALRAAAMVPALRTEQTRADVRDQLMELTESVRRRKVK